MIKFLEQSLLLYKASVEHLSMITRYLVSQRELIEKRNAPSEHNFILHPTTKVKLKIIIVNFFFLEKF